MTGSSDRLTGGCQCGALRYEWLERPTHSSVCYCRMCQKASGQPFMGLTGGEREKLRWTRGTLSIFKSSNAVERGFCRDCGTPLTYSFVSAGHISVAINSLDDPEAMPPTRQFDVESKVAWDAALRLGCDLAQGYYLGKPMPAPELISWLGESWPVVAAAT